MITEHFERRGICTKSSKTVYICPRCNVRYCSVDCFRHPDHLRCSEKFYSNCVFDELKSLPEPSKVTNYDLPTASDLWKDASAVDVLEERQLDEMLASLGVNANDDLFELLTGEEKEEFLKIWKKHLTANAGQQRM
ncbi:zf-HIT domain containing protein [Trichuris trichiura]|uniref:Zf-HIT domain containing protein n=1 Tax=Trichuris trichiura TaxID=36087 RepID=A0A077ZBE9_TRITR|nr:zf-HIT domain containing protein [Trichuris trichiura]